MATPVKPRPADRLDFSDSLKDSVHHILQASDKSLTALRTLATTVLGPLLQAGLCWFVSLSDSDQLLSYKVTLVFYIASRDLHHVPRLLQLQAVLPTLQCYIGLKCIKIIYIVAWHRRPRATGGATGRSERGGVRLLSYSPGGFW